MGILRLPDGMVAVARVVKSYGTAGEVIVKFDSTYAEYMYDLAELPLFMEFEGAKVPFSRVPLAKGQRWSNSKV